MHTYESVWEDEDTNRHVRAIVKYTVDNTEVTISQVTPTQVTFLCPETKNEVRSIGVCTEAGRHHLTSKLQKSGWLDVVRRELASLQSNGVVA